jgi:hypothetical protein
MFLGPGADRKSPRRDKAHNYWFTLDAVDVPPGIVEICGLVSGEGDVYVEHEGRSHRCTVRRSMVLRIRSAPDHP